MIFNSQGSAEKRTYISGGEITPGEEDVVLPGGAYLLGDLTIKAVKRYAKELVYIQSNEAQYIDTGFKPDQNTRIKIDLDVTAQNSQSALVGARNGSASGAFCLWTYSNNNGYQDDYGAAQNYPVGGTSMTRWSKSYITMLVAEYLHMLKRNRRKNDTKHDKWWHGARTDFRCYEHHTKQRDSNDSSRDIFERCGYC